MSTRYWVLSAILTTLTALPVCAQGFEAGNVVVLRVGGLSSSSSAVFLDQYNPTTNTLINSTAVSTEGPNRLTISGADRSEGNITLSADGKTILVAGYREEPGTFGIATSDAPTTNRIVNSYSYDGIERQIGASSAFSGTVVRSAVSDTGLLESNTYLTGGGNINSVQKLQLAASDSFQITSEPTNLRMINIFNGQLYASRAIAPSGATRGIFQIGTDLPTGTTTSQLVLDTGSSSQVNSFAISPDSQTIYTADLRTNGEGGISRWDFNGSDWSLTASFLLGGENGGEAGSDSGAVGLTVDFQTHTLYATTTGTSTSGANNRLVSLRFDQGGFVDFNTIATASHGTTFRGVVFSPVPEPGLILAIGFAGLGVVGWVRRRRAAEPAVAS